jgi:hypothetical protein
VVDLVSKLILVDVSPDDPEMRVFTVFDESTFKASGVPCLHHLFKPTLEATQEGAKRLIKRIKKASDK